MSQFTEASVPEQSGRVAVVTGANAGLGYETARVLAQRSARVLLLCRSAEKGEAARSRIVAHCPSANVEVVQVDLGSLASIARAAERILEEPRLDLLINNAGIMYPPRQETQDGFESQLGVNHLGHFALSARLMELVEKTGGARVVTVSSNAHRLGKVTIDFDDLHAKKRYNRYGRYNMSKLANLLFAYELQRRFEAAGIDAISVASHPGASMTDLLRYIPKAALFVARPVLPMVMHPPHEAALTTLRAATDPDVQGGQYYGPAGLQQVAGPPVLVRSSKSSHDRETARRLWDVSIELTGVDPGI